MIFKKNDWSQTAPNKSYANGQRPAQNGTSQATRREPEIAPRSASNTYTPSPQATVTPVSPLASAQTRRGNGAASYSRNNDQLRKLTVGRDISLNGEITTCDHLVVEGTVKATIRGGKILEITETGAYEGMVDIEQADIAGQFNGELTVRGKLTIRPTATVTGHIQYGGLQVDTGAVINGRINALQDGAAMTATDGLEKPAATTVNSLSDAAGFLQASA